MYVRKPILLSIIFLSVPILFNLVKVPVSVPCNFSSYLVVENIHAEIKTVSCQGIDVEVLATLHNAGPETFNGFVQIDGWDARLNIHVTGTLVRVRLAPGERKTIREILSIYQLQEPYVLEKYIFNITALEGFQHGNCGEREIPLYQYLLFVLRR